MAAISLTFYTTCTTLDVGCVLYANPTYTILAPNGYFSIGDYTCFTITGGTGTITDSSPCPTPTPIPPGGKGTLWRLEAFGDPGGDPLINRATFKYVDENGNLQQISVAASSSINVCCACGTTPVKQTGNGTRSPIGSCGAGLC